ncbi:hypothetical protein BHE74_00016990 [Ensete ventricosum]|nr:hypothetical protein BHE74_00016990 [Ensete ventricosum]
MMTLPLTIGEEPRTKTLMVVFMVVDPPSTYNAIIGQPTLNRLRAVVSTFHRSMKFLTNAGVGEARSDPRESRRCYLTATTLPMKLRTTSPEIDLREHKELALNPEPVEGVKENLDLLEEKCTEAHLRELTYKKAVVRLYDSRVCPRQVAPGDLVLRRAEVSDPTQTRGKLAPTWEGLYRVIKVIREGTYILVNLDGRQLSRT